MSNITDYITALTDLSEAICLSSPTEETRLLISLASYQVPATGAVQVANALAIRVANIAALGYALAELTPISSNEAQDVLAQVIPLFDAIITDASDATMDDTARELRVMKAYVVTHLETLALSAPALITVTNQASLPASVIAYSLYRDARRADELIFENDPVNPIFMANSIKALSS